MDESAPASLSEPPEIAVSRLFDSVGQRILAVGLRVCGNRADAEDLVQETFLQAFRKWSQFRGESAPTTWLYTIAVQVSPSPHSRQACLDLLYAKQESLDRGVKSPDLDRALCPRCRAVFATLDLAHEVCREIGQGRFPASLREAVSENLAGP